MYGHLKDQEYYNVGKIIFYNERIQNLVRQVMYMNHIAENNLQPIEKDVFAQELQSKFRKWLKGRTPKNSHASVDYFVHRITECNKFRNSVTHSMPFLKMFKKFDKEYMPYLNLLRARSNEEDEFEFSNIIISFEDIKVYFAECQSIYEILVSILSSKKTPKDENGKYLPKWKFRSNRPPFFALN